MSMQYVRKISHQVFVINASAILVDFHSYNKVIIIIPPYPKRVAALPRVTLKTHFKRTCILYALRSLRSANTNLLSVPCVRTTFASRGFSVAAPMHCVELAPIWHSRLFLYPYLPSPS